MSTSNPIKPPYKVVSGVGANKPMFTLLLSSVVIATGTYFLYRYLFQEADDDDYDIEEDNFEVDEEEDDGDGYRLRIFFGSQSGTAEGFAFDMEKEAKKFGFAAKAIDLEDYDPEELQNEQLVIFLVATYGEGEPTDNAQEFYNWLTSGDRMDDELTKLEFTVFGLGNSQYEFFNAMGKQFDAKLEEFGGERIFEKGEGDDDIGSIEDQFGEWKQKLYPLLCSKYLGIDDIGVSKFESSIQVEVIPTDHDQYDMAKQVKLPYNYMSYEDEEYEDFLPTRHKPYSKRIGVCELVESYQLRQNTKEGSTLHMEFNLCYNEKHNAKNKILQYHTADNMGFIVRNDYQQMVGLCKRLNLSPSDIIHVKPMEPDSKPNWTYPSITSIRNLFLWYLDINGCLGKKLLTTLANDFTSDVNDKNDLLKMCENITDEVSKKHLTLLDVLNKFESIDIDLPSIVELLKPIQPRLYTIASTSTIDPNKVSICIKLEREDPMINDEKTDNDEQIYKFNGVCSNYFTQSKKGDLFQYYIEESKFRLPGHKIPVIMIGVGAGLAPFAAFIDEANANILALNNVKREHYGDWWLFFGCRYKIGDYIYKDKLESAYNDKNGCLSQLKVAFSREQKKKVYVQHLIEESQEELWDLIHNKKARIYVCGGVAMGKAVRETFTKIFTFYHKSKNGHEYLDDMLKKDIYVQELWG